MSQIELITGLPDWKWGSKARQEMVLTGQALIDETDVMLQIGKVGVIGFVYQSFTSAPWMWFLLARGTTISDLLDLRRQSRKIPEGTITAVEASYKVGLKFAKLFGFVETGDVRDYFGRDYLIMRKI